MIEIGRRPIGSARPSRSGWAAGDTIPALTERALELEAQIASIQADLEKERRRLASYSEFDVTLNNAVANAYREAGAIQSRARAEANEILERAVNERKILLKEVDRLRQERDELHAEVASLRRGALAPVPAAVEPAARPAFDLGTAVVEEMRAMLAELLGGVRARPAPMAPSAAIAPPEVPPLPAVEIAVPPTETSEAILGDIEVRGAELAPPHREIQSKDVVAEVGEPIVDEDIDERRRPDVPAEPSREPEPAMAPLEPPVRVFDEYVEEFVDPEIGEPVVDEYVEGLRSVELPPPHTSETEIDLAPSPSEPISEYVEEPRRTETPPEPATPAPSANLEALWEAAAPLTAEVEPPPAPPATTTPIVEAMPGAALRPLERASFITDEFIAATRPGSPQGSESAAVPPFIDIPVPAPLAEQKSPAPFAEIAAPPPVVEPALRPSPGVRATEPALRQIQVLISPVYSFRRLIEIQSRLQSLSTVQALQVRDFRNGVATIAVSVAQAISPHEFGAVIQMLEDLHLRLEGTGQNSVELRVLDDTPSA